ncbi:MAG: hypothetical protein GC181_07225 [Bacteroidetes bacterium]|nr:hypothetical protein [Bacteroidota bacterium]
MSEANEPMKGNGNCNGNGNRSAESGRAKERVKLEINKILSSAKNPLLPRRTIVIVSEANEPMKGNGNRNSNGNGNGNGRAESGRA